MNGMNGYSHPGYAASLAEFGKPRALPRSSGWILERPILGTPYRDAMGCYPLFACRDWSRLDLDLEELRSELVTLTVVADPFGNHDPAQLGKCFPTLVTPFKEHLVTELSGSPESFVATQHRRKAQKALERVDIERVADPTAFADQWIELYANLVQRHGIRGLTVFSAASFRAQLAVPGISLFRVISGHETVGMTLWYTNREVAYYHLGAYSDLGYELEASFALFWYVLESFSSQGLQWLDLGAGAGLSTKDRSDGLTRFKRGWATGTRMAYLCGRIFDHSKYEQAVRARNLNAGDYFPPYRTGEFA
ncbi:MAG TPA: GNAT family N-acetyltransferase [Pyrinomonadaceae bacterium]|nr:GNAT family N-acetyltransferase [Pyrinomonadaceae bacterium]